MIDGVCVLSIAGASVSSSEDCEQSKTWVQETVSDADYFCFVRHDADVASDWVNARVYELQIRVRKKSEGSGCR